MFVFHYDMNQGKPSSNINMNIHVWLFFNLLFLSFYNSKKKKRKNSVSDTYMLFSKYVIRREQEIAPTHILKSLQHQSLSYICNSHFQVSSFQHHHSLKPTYFRTLHWWQETKAKSFFFFVEAKSYNLSTLIPFVNVVLNIVVSCFFKCDKSKTQKTWSKCILPNCIHSMKCKHHNNKTVPNSQQKLQNLSQQNPSSFQILHTLAN